jgi:hypothetical protein
MAIHVVLVFSILLRHSCSQVAHRYQGSPDELFSGSFSFGFVGRASSFGFVGRARHQERGAIFHNFLEFTFVSQELF